MIPSAAILEALEGVLSEEELITRYDRVLRPRGRSATPSRELQRAYAEFLASKDSDQFQERMGLRNRSQVITALGKMHLFTAERARSIPTSPGKANSARHSE